MVYGLWSMVYGLWFMVYCLCLWTIDYGLLTALLLGPAFDLIPSTLDLCDGLKPPTCAQGQAVQECVSE
jgi:hypothetical protein